MEAEIKGQYRKLLSNSKWIAEDNTAAEKKIKYVHFDNGPSYLRGLRFNDLYEELHCRPENESDISVSSSFDMYGTAHYSATIPLINMPEFAEAFNCSVGAPMHPISKTCPVF